MHVLRLSPKDRDLARALFAVMAQVFAEDSGALSDDYLDRLLGRADFWAIAAFEGEQIVGGITAHTLLLTRKEAAEIFIYDLAVLPEYQRRGVGRQLVAELRSLAAATGVRDVFVAAANEDAHALDFYRALGGEAEPVTVFTFTDGEAD